MLETVIQTTLSSGILGVASYLAVASAIINPVGLAAIGVTGIVAGVYLQIKQNKEGNH